MIHHTIKRSFTSKLTLIYGLIIFISFSSFTSFKTRQSTLKKNHLSTENNLQKSVIEITSNTYFPVWEYFESYWSILLPGRPYSSAILPNDSNLASPYFTKIYYGNGVDHMNINLVDLIHSGLKVGDEIGVFDGSYCVGSTVIGMSNIDENNLSIPSSANDTIESSPNGFIAGHQITLKAYRAGTVYQLSFQTVNESQDIFEIRGSMFALVDFQQSSEQSEEIRVSQNPLNGSFSFDIYLPQAQNLKCEIIDLNGQLVKSLFNSEAVEHISLIWDGTDNDNQKVPSGMYVCQVNQTSVRVLYNKLDDQ